MIVDLDQEVKVFNKELGIQKVSKINVQEKTVEIENGSTVDWKDIVFVHEII